MFIPKISKTNISSCSLQKYYQKFTSLCFFYVQVHFKTQCILLTSFTFSSTKLDNKHQKKKTFFNIIWHP